MDYYRKEVKLIKRRIDMVTGQEQEGDVSQDLDIKAILKGTYPASSAQVRMLTTPTSCGWMSRRGGAERGAGGGQHSELGQGPSSAWVA